MTSKAHVEFDHTRFGIKVALMRDYGSRRELLQWSEPTVFSYDPSDHAGGVDADDASWLRLPDEDARALYDALADHFGHSGNDTRALRRDYDAERGRVDKLIENLVRRA